MLNTTECPIAKGELMLIVARRVIVDLPLYIFMTLRSEAKTPLSSGLSYELLTQFRHDVGYMDSPFKDRKSHLGAICRSTLSRSIAQLRRQQIQKGIIAGEP